MHNISKIERASGLVAALTAADPLFDERQTAEFLGNISVRTLQRWRYERRGPVYLLLGKIVRYRKSSLDRYLETVQQDHCVAGIDVKPETTAQDEPDVSPSAVSPKLLKIAAPTERGTQIQPPGGCGQQTGRTQTPAPVPDLPGPRTNSDVVVQHFVAERTRLWPDAGAVATDNLGAEAAVLLRGDSVSVLIRALSDRMSLAASKDRPPPTSLRGVVSGTPL